MDSGVEAKPVHSTNSSTRAFRGDLYFARAAANCAAMSAGPVLQVASRSWRLVPKRWMSVAGTTPASLATSARVSSAGLRRCMTRAAAARIFSSEVSRGRGDIFIERPGRRRQSARSGGKLFPAAPDRQFASITEWPFIFHLTLMNGRLLLSRFAGEAAMEIPATYTPPDLHGKIALVAGATRGVGRGTALALGEAGATVYCTGRSTRTKRRRHSRAVRRGSAEARKALPADYYKNRPETIEETAELVSARGGKGIAGREAHCEDPEGTEAAARAGQRHFGKRGARIRKNVLAGRPGERICDVRQRGAHAHHHQPFRGAAADRDGERQIGKRADRGNRRRRFLRVPGTSLFRHDQDDGDPASVCHGAGAAKKERGGGGVDAGLSALGGDAGAFRCDGGQLAGRGEKKSRLHYVGNAALCGTRGRGAGRRPGDHEEVRTRVQLMGTLRRIRLLRRGWAPAALGTIFHGEIWRVHEALR